VTVLTEILAAYAAIMSTFVFIALLSVPGRVDHYCRLLLGEGARAAREPFRTQSRTDPLPLCYEPHFDRAEQGLPNRKYLPHVHARSVDHAGRPVAIIWEGRGALG
jgi:hypothetical protein